MEPGVFVTPGESTKGHIAMTATESAPSLGNLPSGQKVLDALVVGAGFSGVRSLIELRAQGLDALALDNGSDVGGTWYWNRYPGARTDSPGICYGFELDDLPKQWRVRERYPSQAEVQKYIAFVVDKYKLRDYMRFNKQVLSAHFDDDAKIWKITTADDTTYLAKLFIPCLGHLTQPKDPHFEGLETFTGRILQTSRWPNEDIDFRGQRVVVVGTGASAIQVIPEIAPDVDHLTVLQRTPNYIMPSRNRYITDAEWDDIQRNYSALWKLAKENLFGLPVEISDKSFADVTDPQEREALYEAAWLKGGFNVVFGSFNDIVIDEESNHHAAEFIRKKIKQIVTDPEVAELLCPKDYPFVAKRPPAGTDYYETFNRGNVSLVDIKADPISHFHESGVALESGRTIDADVVILALGFDSCTGAYERIDIRGRDGLRLSDYWADGPKTHLGISVPNFPNMLMYCGPQSLNANIPTVVDLLAEWLQGFLDQWKLCGADTVADIEDKWAEEWTEENQRAYQATIIPSDVIRNWYTKGVGKDQSVMIYFGGIEAYRAALEASRTRGYSEYTFE